MPVKKTNKKGGATRGGKALTAEEKAAMRETIAERKAEQEGKDLEAILLAKVASLPEPDRSMAKKLHAIVKASGPSLQPKTWYGMPAYANKDGKVICWLSPASKFKERYSSFAFSDKATLDDGDMWPTAFALNKMTPAAEAKIASLVKKAVAKA